MAGRMMEIRLEGHVVNEAEGHWCDRCNRSSVTRYTVLVVNAESLHTWHREIVEYCEHCDDDEDEP